MILESPTAADWADWRELTADTDDPYGAEIRSAVPLCTPRHIDPWERDDIAERVRKAFPFPF